MQISSELSELVDKHVGTARGELLHVLAMEAAKWELSRQLLPSDAPALELANVLGAAVTMRKEELANGRPRPPSFDGGEDEELCVACWRQRLQR